MPVLNGMTDEQRKGALIGSLLAGAARGFMGGNVASGLQGAAQAYTGAVNGHYDRQVQELQAQREQELMDASQAASQLGIRKQNWEENPDNPDNLKKSLLDVPAQGVVIDPRTQKILFDNRTPGGTDLGSLLKLQESGQKYGNPSNPDYQDFMAALPGLTSSNMTPSDTQSLAALIRPVVGSEATDAWQKPISETFKEQNGMDKVVAGQNAAMDRLERKLESTKTNNGFGGTSNLTASQRSQAEIAATKIHEYKALLSDFPGGNRPGSQRDIISQVYNEMYPDESLSDRIADAKYARSPQVQGQIKVLKAVGPVMQRVYDKYKEMGATQDGGVLNTVYNYGNEKYQSFTGKKGAAALKQAKFDFEREGIRGLTQVGVISDSAAQQFQKSLRDAANLNEVADVLNTFRNTVNARISEMNRGQTGNAANLFGNIELPELKSGAASSVSTRPSTAADFLKKHGY